MAFPTHVGMTRRVRCGGGEAVADLAVWAGKGATSGDAVVGA